MNNRPAEFKHLVFLDHTARLSGAELALREMAAWDLADRVSVVLHEAGPLVNEIELRGVDVTVIPMPMALRVSRTSGIGVLRLLAIIPAILKHMRNIGAHLKAVNADIVYANTISTLVFAGLAARLSGCKVVWHVRDALRPPHYGRVVAVALCIVGRCVCTGIVANSNYTLAAIRRYLGRVPTLVLASPVPNAARRSAPAGTSQSLRVAMIGRLTSWKGQHIFIDAFASAFGSQPGVFATIAGDALFPGDEDYRLMLKQQIRKLGLEERVILAGHISDIPSLLSRSDILVHASVMPEPFGQVVSQGLRGGVAVIASNEGGPAEMIQSGVNGILVQPGTSHALSDALRCLSDDRAKLRFLASNATASSDCFSPIRLEEELRTFLNSLA